MIYRELLNRCKLYRQYNHGIYLLLKLYLVDRVCKMFINLFLIFKFNQMKITYIYVSYIFADTSFSRSIENFLIKPISSGHFYFGKYEFFIKHNSF